MSNDQKRIDDVTAAYREVFGRNPDPGGLETWTRSGLSGDKLRAVLASSEEGQRQRADPTKFGAKVVDPESLSERQREYYEVWRRKNPNSVLYDIILDTEIKQRMNAGSAQYWEQVNQGNIIERPEYTDPETGEKVNPSVIISREGAQALGADLGAHISGTRRGVEYYFPSSIRGEDGSEVALKFRGNVSGAQSLTGTEGTDFEGFQVAVATGSKSSGLFGSVVGKIGEAIGSSALERFGNDPLRALEKYGGKGLARTLGAVSVTVPFSDLYADTAFGSRGGERLDQWQYEGIRFTGVEADDLEMAQGFVERAAVTAVQAIVVGGTGGLGTPVAMGIEAGYQTAKGYQASQYNRDFDLRSAAIDVAFAGIPVKGATAASTVGRAAVREGARSAVQQRFSEFAGFDLAGRGIENDGDIDWGVVGERAAVGAVGALTGLRSESGSYFIPGGSILGVNPYTTALEYGFADSPEARRAVLLQAGVGAATSTVAGVVQSGSAWRTLSESVTGSFRTDRGPTILDPQSEGSWAQQVRNQLGAPRVANEGVPQFAYSEDGTVITGLASSYTDPRYGQFSAGTRGIRVVPVRDPSLPGQVRFEEAARGTAAYENQMLLPVSDPTTGSAAWPVQEAIPIQTTRRTLPSWRTIGRAAISPDPAGVLRRTAESQDRWAFRTAMGPMSRSEERARARAGTGLLRRDMAPVTEDLNRSFRDTVSWFRRSGS